VMMVVVKVGKMVDLLVVMMV